MLAEPAKAPFNSWTVSIVVLQNSMPKDFAKSGVVCIKRQLNNLVSLYENSYVFVCKVREEL